MFGMAISRRLSDMVSIAGSGKRDWVCIAGRYVTKQKHMQDRNYCCCCIFYRKKINVSWLLAQTLKRWPPLH